MSIVVSNNARDIITKIGNKINSPQQRLLQGIAALAIQPIIDYNNKKVDDDTRRVAVARTIGKIIAGTIVGVAVRSGSINLVKQLSKTTLHNSNKIMGPIIKASKMNIFTPERVILPPNFTRTKFDELYKNYVKSMGTAVATIAMMFTNFAIDAPLTKVLTKFMEPKVQKLIDREKKGAANVPK